MTTVREFTEQVTASVVASFLEDNGIKVSLTDENAAAWSGLHNAIPIRLQVEDDQAEEANTLLEQFDAAPPLTDEAETKE
ncbi:hypothetical protein BH09VER1_BH09VER1_04960 [soil metagenome]